MTNIERYTGEKVTRSSLVWKSGGGPGGVQLMLYRS